MPIVWRYLLRHFLQTFVLCVCSFVSILIVLRLQEIARFATSGVSVPTTLYFAILQIPYILPIALPVSCLIATLLLFRKLSHTHELTALRTCGLGLRSLLIPLFYMGIFLSVLNFSIASEISPRCRALSKQLIFEIASANPLFILQRDSLVKFKGAYYHIDTLSDNTHAKEVLFAIRSGSTDRMSLMCAKELQIEGDLLVGKQVAFISSATPTHPDPHFDHLVIENQSLMKTKSADLSQFLQNADWQGHCDYLSFRGLKAHSIAKHGSFLKSKDALMEGARRISIGLAALTFTMVGASFGMELGRNPSKKRLLMAVFLTAAFLACFIGAKSFHASPTRALLLFLLPHPLILLICLYTLKRTNRGIE